MTLTTRTKLIRVGNEEVVLVYLYTMKKEKKEKYTFDRLIRIRKRQLEWLRKSKNTKTMAGFLDIIINYYRSNAVRTNFTKKEKNKL